MKNLKLLLKYNEYVNDNLIKNVCFSCDVEKQKYIRNKKILKNTERETVQHNNAKKQYERRKHHEEYRFLYCSLFSLHYRI